MRAMDACWLVRNTDLSRSSIAGVLGISRVTLNQYLKDAGMDEDYLAMVRARQQEQGVVLFSPDISAYLATGESE
jgi:DNA-binding transcriptional regulator LsrR (DeoR family)